MGSGAEIFNQVINQGGSPALLTNTLALRPSFGYTGRIFIASDTREIYRDTGTSWELIGSGSGSVNIYNSNGTLTGARTVTMAGNNILFTDNKNSSAAISIQNTGTSGGTDASLQLITDAGTASIGKRNLGNSGYKIISAGNGYIYDNNTLAILADSGTAIIKFAAGGGSTAQMTLFSTGRLGLNTTVDAGFQADIQGSTRIIRSIFSNLGLQILTNAGAVGGISLNGTAVASNIMSVSQSFALNQTNTVTTGNAFNIQSAVFTTTSGLSQLSNFTCQFGASSGNANFIGIGLTPFLNFSGTYNGIVRGFYYAPNVASLANSLEHYCFESTAGKMVVTNVTAPSNTVQTTTAAFNHRYDIPAGASYSIGLPFGSITPVNYMVFAGSATIGAANIWAANSSFNQFAFDAPGSTVTVNQITLRSISALSAQHQFYGTNSGTITHLSGLQVTGFYNANTGVITPVINNGYGVLINNLDDYGHTFTLVNRWGIYQDGTSDNNYLAGKLLVGTNTVTARQVHIAGDVELTTTLSGSAGGSSGQHLNIWVNGNQYKIKLENP
jgi:hypothetical protein